MLSKLRDNCPTRATLQLLVVTFSIAITLPCVESKAQERQELPGVYSPDVRQLLESRDLSLSTESQAGIDSEQTRARLRDVVSNLKPETTQVDGVRGSVAATARCAEGFVVSHQHRASAPDVEIVSEQLIDCQGNQCRAYQVNATTKDAAPFDLTVSVTCSG
jgi:hypothetical protein